MVGFTIVKITAKFNHDISPNDIGFGDVIQIIAGAATVTAAVLVVTTGAVAAAPLIGLLGLTAAVAQLVANQNGYTVGDVANAAGILLDVNNRFSAARNWTAPRDPLVLDLDGDGIEAVGINPAAPILFDHDGDGTRTGTGWIKGDDGIVVLDRNGNGLIDNGGKLFGDNTVLHNGPRAGQKAANGYEALADLDANGDGQLNSSDAAYRHRGQRQPPGL